MLRLVCHVCVLTCATCHVLTCATSGVMSLESYVFLLLLVSRVFCLGFRVYSLGLLLLASRVFCFTCLVCVWCDVCVGMCVVSCGFVASTVEPVKGSSEAFSSDATQCNV